MSKKFFIFLFSFLLLSTFYFSQSLVELSKRNREADKRVKKKGVVITNADLKKIKGGSVVIEKGKATPQSATSETEQFTPEEKAAYNKIYQLAGQLYAHKAEKEIKNLQLAKLRKTYFASDNGPYRDNVIKPQMQKIYQDIKMLDLKISEDKDSLSAAKKELVKKGISQYVINLAERKAKEEVDKNLEKEKAKYITPQKKSRFSPNRSLSNNVDSTLKSRSSRFDIFNKKSGAKRLTPAEKLKIKQGLRKKNQ